MAPAVLAALISGGAGLLGGGLNLFGQKGADRRQNEGALEAQRLANKHNVDFWKMQNQYNDPSQQMARLVKAGLNPHLVYGGSPGQAAGVAGQIAPSKAAPVQHSNLPAQLQLQQTSTNALSAFNQQRATDAQVQKTKAEELHTLSKTRYQHLANGAAQEYFAERNRGKAIDNDLNYMTLAAQRGNDGSGQFYYDMKKAEYGARREKAELSSRLAKHNLLPSDDTLTRWLVMNDEEVIAMLKKAGLNAGIIGGLISVLRKGRAKAGIKKPTGKGTTQRNANGSPMRKYQTKPVKYATPEQAFGK